MISEDTELEDVILNLKMISKIKQNNKLVIINKTLHVDQRLLQPVFRWYTADNRYDTVNFITSVINHALDNTLHVKHPVFDVDKMKEELLSTIQGLENLSATYKLDNLIVSKIDILIDKINKICV
uniref:Uncharacterized protein n=1 Tax=viral metagenome TaxID=1070528 RepID=A0A6C0CM16_9ZZZZ